MTRLNREGMAACQAGDYDAAARLLCEGVDLARRAGVSMYEAKMRNNLGLVRLLSERPDEAAREFSRALQLVEGKIGRDNALHARIEGNLGKAASLVSA
jgi:tetratricopeptide (TPR) repeat protein